MKLERHLDGRNRRESSAKGDVAFCQCAGDHPAWYEEPERRGGKAPQCC
jgi:hypothetical protein